MTDYDPSHLVPADYARRVALRAARVSFVFGAVLGLLAGWWWL